MLPSSDVLSSAPTLQHHTPSQSHTRGGIIWVLFVWFWKILGKLCWTLYASLYFHLTSTPPSAAVDKDIQRSVDMYIYLISFVLCTTCLSARAAAELGALLCLQMNRRER